MQAYDLDMQIPGTPEAPIDDEHAPSVVGEVSSRTSPRILHSDLIVPMPGVRASSGSKRRRSQSTSSDDAERSPKHRAIGGLLTSPRDITPRTAALRSVVQESSQITGVSHSLTGFAHQPDQESLQASPLLQGAKVTKIRELMRIIVNEALSFGGRPDSAIATETELGERIDVRTRSSKGDAYSKIVEWSVAPTVPEDLLVDERDFTKLVSVLFLNALKFTTKGQIKLQTSLSPKSRYVVITVIDTGTGIPAVFRPNLFKPFSREDDSLTRQSEGLGLGLMVAKGLARKVGGDLICVRSDTEGPQRGSEFELRVPLSPSDGISRHSTPSRTPTPFRSDRSLTPTFMETSSSVPNPPKSPVRSIVEPTQLVLPTIRALDSLTTNLLNGGRRESEVQAARATRSRRSVKNTIMFDRKLAQKCPLNFLIAEDNRINRKLLVNMLSKLGYTGVHEAYDGTEAVRLMELDHGRGNGKHIDVILMDLWMPDMDGYEAAERILAMEKGREDGSKVKILAVTADITDVALDRAREVGMVGYMTKPYKLLDLERLIIEHYSPGPGR